MEIFSIVLLPCERDLTVLDSIKLKFNREGFRHKISDTTSHAHVTLAQGIYENEKRMDIILQELAKELEKFIPVKVEDYSITREKRMPNEKVDYVNYWIALKFNNKDIEKLSEVVDKYLLAKNISLTNNYIEDVSKIDPTSVNNKVVGDHLNLCNYCREIKAEEAYNLVKGQVPKTLIFDSIGFRYKGKDLNDRLILGKSS